MAPYLFVFSQALPDFRLSELDAILSFFGIDDCTLDRETAASTSAAIFELPNSDSVRQILSRTLLTKCVCELISHGRNYEQLCANLRTDFDVQKFMRAEDTFCFRLISLNRKRTGDYNLRRFEEVADCFPFEVDGRINLRNPTHMFCVVELHSSHDLTPADESLDRVFFGRMVDYGQRVLPHKYNLSTRCYIGNTTMDPQLSFLQANLAKIGKGSLVFDPFVGTGGLLIAAAHFGGICVGTEINYSVLHGIGKSSRVDKRVWSREDNALANFKQYGLLANCAGLLVADSSCGRLWRSDSLFDAIVTDPPYGLREGSRKVGRRERTRPKDADETGVRYPRKAKYELSDVFLDLLNLAARYLRVGGRLAYWFPVFPEDYSDAVVPRHPCLALVANCEQPLPGNSARRLLVMEKRRQPTDADAAASVADNVHAKVSFRDKSLGLVGT